MRGEVNGITEIHEIDDVNETNGVQGIDDVNEVNGVNERIGVNIHDVSENRGE